MIRLHCTKKLFVKLPVNAQGHLVDPKNLQRHRADMPESLNPLSGWYGNLILLQRRNCILLVHDETRFPLFIPCLTKPDFARLNWFFEDALMNTLMKCGASEEQLQTASQLIQPLVLDTECNRSLQGVLNSLKQDVDHALWLDNASVTNISAYGLSSTLANRPSNLKSKSGLIFPAEAMLSLLDHATNLVTRTTAQVDHQHTSKPDLPNNIVSFAAFKKGD